MGCKLVEITININNTFGPGTANACTVWWWSKKFYKGDESLEDEECSGQPPEGDNHQPRALSKLTRHEKLPKNSMLTILWLCGIWSKLERWTSLISGCLMSWLNIKKIFWTVIFFYCTQQQIISQSDRDMRWKVDFIWQPAMISSVVGPRWSSKALLTAKLAPKKKIMVTVWWSAARLIHCNFLNPGETITSEKYAQQIDEMHGKLQRLQPALVNRKGPVLPHDNAWLHVTQPVIQKLNKLGYKVLPHPPYSPDLLPTNYHFFKHLTSFLQGKCFHNQQEAKNVFQEFIESQSMDFYATGINNLISHWQKCVDCNFSYFD